MAENEMKICIVGGGGAIGGYLAVMLARAGNEVTVVARGATDVHVLAEDGELFCQITVKRRQLLKARPRKYFLR